MKLTKQDLRRLLTDQPPPEPAAGARERARAAARAAFDERAAELERAKGTAGAGRPMGRTQERRPAMRKLGYALGSLAVVAVLAAVIVPNFLQFRMKASSSAVPGSRVQQYLGGHPEAYMVEADRTVQPRQEYVGRDRFETSQPNPVKVAAEEPVSTFSIDVDTASYSFVRRALNEGHLPQKAAVRIEEMINYFPYDYPAPKDPARPFRPSVAVLPAPWDPGKKLLHIGIRGYDAPRSRRPRANLVFLVDVSGSMDQPDKLPLLVSGLRLLVGTLRPEDRVGIVVYAGSAGTVLEPTPAGERGRILAALDGLRAGGSTAGGEGIRRAYEMAEAGFDPEGVNRVILATDGDFNVGIRDPEELKGFVERKRRTGIELTVLGFGQGNLNDALMQKLAQNGNGNAAYIDTLSEARKVLVEQAGGTLFTIARDVKIQVEFNPAAVAEYRLIGYENRLLRREDFNNDRVDAGDIGAGHTVTAVYEMTPAGSGSRLVDDLRYGGRTPASGAGGGGEYAFLKIRYKLPGSETSRLIETPIGRDVESSSVAAATAEIRFAVAVAAFGQLLRGDPHTGGFGYDGVLALAGGARGEDPFGYRAEFLNLVRLASTAGTMGER